ncbi:hypothetical protein K438DRAFT_1706083 [Mycena galopus ATCC 62051]|nr:hypothetical protein K438DRAFT_1706083 [Mycena galopus ATCC 62051]
MPSPGHIALVAGLVSSSYFTFGNLGASYFGVMPATERGRSTLPVADRLALWDAFYGTAKLHMASSALIAGTALSVAGYTTPAGPLRNIYAAGAVAGYTILIYTARFMLPINNGLIATLRAHNSGVKSMDAKEEQHVLDQLDRWRSLHRFRIVLGIVSLLASTTGLLASDPIIQF